MLRGLALLVALACASCLVASCSGDPPQESEVAVAPPPGPPIEHSARATVRATSPPERPVAGIIIDAAGTAVVDANVEVTAAEGAGAQSAQTDAKGAFRLDVPARAGDRIRISGAGLMTTEVRWQEGGAVPRILVERAVTVAAVVSHRESPVAGARVWIRDGSDLPVRAATSSAGGEVAFAGLWPGAYELWAEKDGRVSPLARVSVFEAAAPQPVELALGDGSAVTVRLRDQDGHGLKGTLSFVPVGFDHALRRIESDSAEASHVSALPRGRWRLIAEAPGFVTREFSLSADESQESIEVRLSPGAVVGGRVVDGDGAPVARAALVLHSLNAAHARIRATPEIPKAAIGMRWIHPLAKKRYLPSRDSRRFGARRDGARPLECGRGHCGVDLGGDRGSAVHATSSGTVVAAAFEGRGRAGRFVAIEHEAGLKSFYMHLDEIRPDLEVGMAVRAGAIVGTLGATGIVRSAPHLHFALSRTERGSPVFIDPEPLLRRAVVLPRSAPARSDGLDMTWIARPLGAAEPNHGSDAPDVVYSDDRGRFTFAGVGPGRYAAIARADDLVPTRSAKFSVSSGAAVDDLEVVLRAGSSVQGRILGPRGPISNARVTARQGEGESALTIAESYSDTDGFYELRRVSGSPFLSVQAAGYGKRTLELVVPRAGPPVLERDFNLPALGSRLVGDLRDPSGFPVRGATVRITEGPSGVGRRTTTDEYGSFAIETVAAGRYTLQISTTDYPTLSSVVTTDARSALALSQGARLEIEVIDRHTRGALAGLDMRAAGPGGRLRRVTDMRGRVQLKGLVAGTWTIVIAADGYVPFKRTLAVSKGRQSAMVELGRGATLAGVLRDGDGERVVGALVAVGQVKTRTDQDGRFRLVDVPTGAVLIRSTKNRSSGTRAMELSPGDEYVTMELRLEEAR